MLTRLDAEAVERLVSDDFTSHSWPSGGSAKEALKAATRRMGQALTDIRFSIDDLIAEGDRAVSV